MGITVQIKSHALLGGGPYSYCVYKIDVDGGREGSWVVYRRYSEFVKLYNFARHEVGNNFRNLGVTAIDNGTGGSVYGTLQETIFKRIPILEEMLQKLVSLDPSRLLNCVAVFIDIPNKGLSGIAVQVGKANVLIESFLQCKHHTLSVWMTHLIVLTKDGILYELGGMHDNSTKAISTIMLRNPDTRIVGRSSKFIVDITYDRTTNNYPGTESTYESCKKLHILFANGSDCANFLRNTSDFTSKPEKTLERGFKAAPVKKQAEKQTVQAQEPVKKADVLSSTYGL